MELEPLFDRVLAKPIKENFLTKSGISTAQDYDRPTKTAKVKKIGKGGYDNGVFVEMQICENDTIFYEEHTVSRLMLENEDFILIKQTDILAKIKGENK